MLRLQHMHIFPQYHPYFRFQLNPEVCTLPFFPSSLLPFLSSFSHMWVWVVLFIYIGGVANGKKKKKVRISHANARDLYFLIQSRRFWDRGLILITVRLMIRCSRRLCCCLLLRLLRRLCVFDNVAK